MRDRNPGIPQWIDEAVEKAVHPNPYNRYVETSEFVYDLHNPNTEFLSRKRQPLLERDPLSFWKGVSLVLVVIVLMLLGSHSVLEERAVPGQPGETLAERNRAGTPLPRSP
jgi:hypothetical protein